MAIFKLSSILKKLERFENNSLKALFGQNMKTLKILQLSPDSRYFQKLALKYISYCNIRASVKTRPPMLHNLLQFTPSFHP